MKVAIVGAGVSGLSTYLQLRKLLTPPNSHTITIYESQKPDHRGPSGNSNAALAKPEGLTDSAAVVGNSILLSPNSVRLLKSIDSGLYEMFRARGYVSETYTFKTARGQTLAVLPTHDGKLPREYSISCPRYELWKCLHEVVGEDKIQYRKVVHVDLEGRKPIVKFVDGGEEDADLVIGADGVRSVVKKAIFGEDDERMYAPHYEGFCGVGAFLDMEIPESITKDKTTVFTFGPAGSFGYSCAAPESKKVLGWWANWGESHIPETNYAETDDIRQQLRERYGTWRDPVIKSIVTNMSTDRIYPIWTTPDLPHWGRAGAVLLGDAAHTLQATGGQGASQALEDGVTFCLLFSHYLGKLDGGGGGGGGGVPATRDVIGLTSKGLYEIRNPRIASIRSQARSTYLSKRPITSVIFEYYFYLFIYLWTNFPAIAKLIRGDWFKEIYEWDTHDQVERYLAEH